MQCHSSSSPVGTDALVCPPLIIHPFVLPNLTHSFSSFYPTSFEIDETPSLPSRNAFFVITERLLRSHETPSLLSRNALVSPYLEVYLEERNMFIQGMLIMLFLSKDASLKQHVFILFRFRNRFLSLVFLCSSVFPNPLL